MTQQLTGWPFALGRGRITEIGHDIIVAPEFLAKRKISGFLMQAATFGQVTLDDPVICRRIVNIEQITDEYSSLTLIYKAFRATKKYVGIDEEGHLSNRVINVTVGILFTGNVRDQLESSEITLSTNWFPALAGRVGAPFKEYWESNKKPPIICLPAVTVESSSSPEDRQNFFYKDDFDVNSILIAPSVRAYVNYGRQDAAFEQKADEVAIGHLAEMEHIPVADEQLKNPDNRRAADPATGSVDESGIAAVSAYQAPEDGLKKLGPEKDRLEKLEREFADLKETVQQLHKQVNKLTKRPGFFKSSKLNKFIVKIIKKLKTKKS